MSRIWISPPLPMALLRFAGGGSADDRGRRALPAMAVWREDAASLSAVALRKEGR
jgi:hypothetical protein